MLIHPYHVAIDEKGKYYIEGPNKAGEFSYYGGYLNPYSRFPDKETAENVCRLVNISYECGQRSIRTELCALLNIKQK